MIVDLLDKSGNYIPSLAETINKLSFRVSTLELGIYELRLTFSPLSDFRSVYDVVPRNGSIRIKPNTSDVWVTLGDNTLNISDVTIKHIDVEISDIRISNMISSTASECFTRFKLIKEIENDIPKVINSPFHRVSMNDKLEIEFDHDVLLGNPIMAAYINVDSYIEGDPIVSMKVTNTVIGGDQSKPINYNWVDVKNGDITEIGPIGTERVGKYTLRFKITVTKNSTQDIFRLYGIFIDMVERQLYKVKEESINEKTIILR